MPAAYLTPSEAQARLVLYSIDATPTAKELELASNRLDLMGGFLGLKAQEDQLRAFPRTYVYLDDVEGDVPTAILDWVALTAYQLSQDDEPPIITERIDTISQQYTRGLRSRVDRMKRH